MSRSIVPAAAYTTATTLTNAQLMSDLAVNRLYTYKHIKVVFSPLQITVAATSTFAPIDAQLLYYDQVTGASVPMTPPVPLSTTKPTVLEFNVPATLARAYTSVIASNVLAINYYNLTSAVVTAPVLATVHTTVSVFPDVPASA